MPTALITGSNRGIGLALARLYARGGWTVLAGCRNPEAAEELRNVARDAEGRVEVLPLDVTRWRGLEQLAGKLAGREIDLLVNNAGVRPMDAHDLGSIGVRPFMDSLRVNTLGPLKLTEALLPNLEAASRPVVVMVSSALGSLARNRSGGDYAYRASKAALNAVMRSLAADLLPRGITVVSLHPGWVRTRMGGPDAPLGVEESAWAIRTILDRVEPGDSGKFLRFDGREEPW